MENKDNHINKGMSAKRYPFHTPDDYFDILPERIMGRIEEENRPANKTIFARYFKPAFGLIVSFAIIAGIIYIPVKLIFPGKIGQGKTEAQVVDEEYILTRTLSDFKLFEALYDAQENVLFDEAELETVLLASVSEYELIEIDE